MEYDKDFFEKIFSTARTRKYFALYPHDESKAIIHYECNIKLSESFYPSMSILEVALRNALARELETYAGRVDWYSIFATTPGLADLNKYITQARKMIVTRGEVENPGKITAELTLGFGHRYLIVIMSVFYGRIFDELSRLCLKNLDKGR